MFRINLVDPISESESMPIETGSEYQVGVGILCPSREWSDQNDERFDANECARTRVPLSQAKGRGPIPSPRGRTGAERTLGLRADGAFPWLIAGDEESRDTTQNQTCLPLTPPTPQACVAPLPRFPRALAPPASRGSAGGWTQEDLDRPEKAPAEPKEHSNEGSSARDSRVARRRQLCGRAREGEPAVAARRT